MYEIIQQFLNRKKFTQEPWPLRFAQYSIDIRCYNTLRCRAVFANTILSTHKHLLQPSGEPYSPDWKKDWNAGFAPYPYDASFPTPVELKWTSLDGVEHETEIDLATVFPDRRIVHNVPREDVDANWASSGYMGEGPFVEILMEVNDRRVSIYMKSGVQTTRKEQTHDGFTVNSIVYELVEVWSKTF